MGDAMRRIRQFFLTKFRAILVIWQYIKECKLADWLCNPCEWSRAPVRLFLEAIVPPQARECWCCSHVRGILYGAMFGISVTIAVYQWIV